MGEAIDLRTLDLIQRLLLSAPDEALFVQRLWRDRTHLAAALEKIRDWDMTHDEALTVRRVIEIVDEALREAGEQ